MIIELVVRGIGVDVQLVDEWNFRDLKLVVRTPPEVSLNPVELASLIDSPSQQWTDRLKEMVDQAQKGGWIDDSGDIRIHVEIDTPGQRFDSR